MENNLLDFFIKGQFNTAESRNRLVSKIREAMTKENGKYEIVCNLFTLEFDFEKNLVQICEDLDLIDDPDVQMIIEDFIIFLQNVEDIPK